MIVLPYENIVMAFYHLKLQFSVENVAFKKESWINNKRQFKRHVRNRWMHGHAARAVDGNFDQTLHRLL